jgi:hypothetical protein
MSEVNTAPAVKLTRAEKLAKQAETLRARIVADTEKYNEVVAELTSIERLANVGVGQLVKIKLGRKFADKDTTRVVDAIIVGVRETEDGEKQYKAQHGIGFDAEIVTVTGAAIVEVAAPNDAPVGVVDGAPQA